MIEISEETIGRIHAILGDVKDADKKVLKPALARGLQAGKTQANKGIKQTYNISAAVLNKYGKISYKSVSESGNEIVGSILFSGGVIPLYKFKVSPNKPTFGTKEVQVAVLKENSAVPFENAFVARFKKHDYVGIFERKGTYKMEGRDNKKKTTPNNEHTEKVKELFGPSVPKMVENAKVMQTVEDRVNEVINQRIDHEIERLLSKSGG